MRTERREFIKRVGAAATLAALPASTSIAKSFEGYEDADATDLALLVKNKEVSPTELLDSAIERIERLNPKLKAVVTRIYDKARTSIENGLPEGPFQGVPFLLKDIVPLEGVRNTAGSKLLRDNIAQYDSELVRRYKQAGFVIVGLTNTPEWGLNVSTEPELFEPTHNPWNLEHTSGGSSGGAASAVAARIVPVAHGNDGGGSIRIQRHVAEYSD